MDNNVDRILQKMVHLTDEIRGLGQEKYMEVLDLICEAADKLEEISS